MDPDGKNELRESREDWLFLTAVGLSALGWAALFACGLGYLLLAAAISLALANGLLIARVRSEGLAATAEQYPELHAALTEACERLGIEKRPCLYILPPGGWLSHITMRYGVRSFLALSSEIAEVAKHDTAAARFHLGYELGRLERHYPLKHLLTLPARFLPYLGSAYTQACVLTCDRYGAVATGDRQIAAKALLTLQGGGELEPKNVAREYQTNRGFFLSWHELTVVRPSTARRVAAVLGEPRAALSPLAYLTAALTLSGFRSAFSSLVFTLVAAAILAGGARPFWKSLKEREDRREARLDRQQRMLSAREILLTQGTIDPRLVGIWAGGSPEEKESSDFLRWRTARKKDGNLQTAYEQRANGEERRWSKHGQWRIFNGKYQEIYDEEKARAYEIVRAEPDSVVLTENPQNAQARITEIRQPGNP